jgi:hypothetical protein
MDLDLLSRQIQGPMAVGGHYADQRERADESQ